MKWCLAAGMFLLSANARAHSISFIQGDALVLRDKVEVRLEIRPEDILLSAGIPFLVPGIVAKADLEKGQENHRQYLLNGLVIEDAAGQRLAGTIASIKAPPIPEDGMPL